MRTRRRCGDRIERRLRTAVAIERSSMVVYEAKGRRYSEVMYGSKCSLFRDGFEGSEGSDRILRRS